MTPEEQEFARLLDTLDNAQILYANLKANEVSQPSYHSESGYLTPTDMVYYKSQLDLYNKSKQSLNEGKKSVEAAVAAIMEWIPAPLHKDLDRGVGAVTRMPGGYAMLFKNSGEYHIVKGKSQQEVQEKVSYFLAMKRA